MNEKFIVPLQQIEHTKKIGYYIRVDIGVI